MSGGDLKDQLARWAEYGCIEPSAAESASAIADLDDLSPLVADRLFVLLGATSAMGPAEVLIRMGASVAAVARPGEKLRALLDLTERDGPAGMMVYVPEMEPGVLFTA